MKSDTSALPPKVQHAMCSISISSPSSWR